MQENVDPSKIKDGNHANRLFNLYWEAPSDPSIYRRKLLNVQKTREKQQAARRGFNRGPGLSRSRSVSPSSQDGMPTVRNAFSNNGNNGGDVRNLTVNTDEANNQASARQLLQGSYQGIFNMSSSMTQFGMNQGLRLLGSSSGAHPGFSGPQSFSESGVSLGFPGSFNEVDFALALHRPGVVPMGDSVTTATTSTTSMSSGNNSRSNYNQTSVGSFGTAQVLHYSSQQRRFATGSVPRTSRSLNEGELAPADAPIPTLINSHLEQVAYSSSQETGIGIGTPIVGTPIELKPPQVEISVDPPMKPEDEKIPDRPPSATRSKPTGYDTPDKMHATTEDTTPTKTEDNSAPATNPNSTTSALQPNQSLGVYDSSQVYQQHLAAMQQQFQQQQLLLQQQQATLALQQEQLRVYYSNLSNAAGIGAPQFGIPGAPSAAINMQQFGIAGAPGIAGAQATRTDSATSQHFGIAGAPPPTMMNAHQFGMPGAPATPSAAVNAQQFAIAGAPIAAIGAQQFGQGTVQAAAALNPQFKIAGTATPVQGGGYYVITNPDGTQMIVPPTQGMAIPMTAGQVPGMAGMPNILPGQLQAMPVGPAQLQGLTPANLPGLPPGAAVAGMPGIQALQAGGIAIPPAASVGPAGIPTINNPTSPVPPGGLYPKNNNQQQHPHHRHP